MESDKKNPTMQELVNDGWLYDKTYVDSQTICYSLASYSPVEMTKFAVRYRRPIKKYVWLFGFIKFTRYEYLTVIDKDWTHRMLSQQEVWDSLSR